MFSLAVCVISVHLITLDSNSLHLSRVSLPASAAIGGIELDRWIHSVTHDCLIKPSLEQNGLSSEPLLERIECWE